MISRAVLTWLRSSESKRPEYIEYLELKDRLDSLEALISKAYRDQLPITKTTLPEDFLPWDK